jgi:hypothetical protein
MQLVIGSHQGSGQSHNYAQDDDAQTLLEAAWTRLSVQRGMLTTN